jgi:signal transduction histidine kinase
MHGRASIVLITVTTLIGSVSAAFAASPPKQVLALYETGRTSQMVIVSDREIPTVLGSLSTDGIDYYAEFVDQTRFHQRDYQLVFRDFLLSKYKDKTFDLIIAMGDNALEFVNATRTDLYPAIPIVFFSTAAAPSRPANSTGVIGNMNFAGSIALALALQPDLRNVFVIDATDSGRGYDLKLRTQLRPFENRLAFTYWTDLNPAVLEARLALLPSRSAIYFYVYSRQGIVERAHPLDYLDRITAIATAPVYSWVDSTMDHGIVGGSLKSQTAQARAVGELGLRVLRGERADAIPIASLDLNANQVDWRQLRRWDISESRVPAGTQILFREPRLWDRYRAYVVAALASFGIQSALIAGLLVQKRRRRRAEHLARHSAAKLRSSYDRIRDLGGRLLVAQEAERARVARELHDDVSQQLALLAFDLDVLRGESPMHRRQADRLVQGACDRAQGLARSVHALSHRLHPVRLQMLGLVASIDGLAHELSTADLPIMFSYDEIPSGVPEDVTVCLFRVVQEALHNALKHSGASHVSVHLASSAHRGLVLTVADNGVGFEVDDAWTSGLGLVSMRERVESVDGRLQVFSKRRAGTHLEIVVPLVLAPVGRRAVAAT